MNSVAGIAGEPLLFHWDSPRRQKAMLASFLVLSLVAHALCFYIFQVVYPTPIAVMPPPARVTFITPNSDEGRTLLRWIDAEDPALAFTTHLPPGATLRILPSVEHVASYSASRPMLKDLPPLKPDLRIPSSRLPGAVPSLSRKAAPAEVASKTLIDFSKNIDRFGASSVPQTRFAASTKEAPEALQFRVAVNDFGEVQYCFAINSSGDPALDEQARLKVIRSRFPPREGTDANRTFSLIWGMATIEWGSDVARPQHAPATSVTP
ncbi:MAG TPA: hypothetical protein VFQ78_10105 [Candidatus Udaeobacter sp.]|jgi:hypothetical protein|nr:hypothetical protein [Candidatus Udaeobacter sp.]